MGSLPGHILPGSMFFFFGLWTVIVHVWYYFHRSAKNKLYKLSPLARAVPCGRCCHRRPKPIEAYCKIFFPSVGAGVESIGFYYGYPEMYQHFTMYFVFIVAGVVDLLIFYKVRGVPKGLDYFAHVIGFTLLCTTLGHHTHGFQGVEILVHLYLLYMNIGCLLMHTICIFAQSSIIVTFLRAYFLIAQGTWFIAVGFIIYPPWGGEIPSHGVCVFAAACNMIGCLILEIMICILLQNIFGSNEITLRSSRSYGNHRAFGKEKNSMDLLPQYVIEKQSKPLLEESEEEL